MTTDKTKAALDAFLESDASDFLDDDSESFGSVAEKVFRIAWEAALTTTPAPTMLGDGEMNNNSLIVPCRTCKGDPETCADVPDARMVYGFHNGKALSCHPLGVESAIETFLRFNGAVFVDGKPVEKFGISTGAMSSAIQAYLDYYRKGVGDTDETRKSY